MPKQAEPAERPEPAIRRASVYDVATIVMLAAEHAEYERSRAQPDGGALAAALDGQWPRLWVWIAEYGTDPLGYAAVTEDFSTWRAQPFVHLDCLFVREPHRNRGVGAALFRQVQGHARDRGITRLEWQTPAWNTDAIRFYERMGGSHSMKARFTQDGERSGSMMMR